MGEQEIPQNQQQNKKRNLSPSGNTTKKSRKESFQIVPDVPGTTEILEILKKKKLKVPLMNTRVERNKVINLNLICLEFICIFSTLYQRYANAEIIYWDQRSLVDLSIASRTT